MIYKYDDIVKTIKGKFIFSKLRASDVGKMITVSGLNSPENRFGGRIDEVCENTIIYEREFIEDGKRKYMLSCITAEGIGTTPDCKICIYDPMTGEHIVYRSDEFVHSTKSKIRFNTDILKPGARFFAENPHGTSICEVLGCGRYILRIKECSLLEGIKIFSLIDDAYNADELKSFTFKTIDELKPYDLCRRGFSGYKLSINAICKIKDILDEEEIIVDE
jgi:hypothetical protein